MTGYFDHDKAKKLTTVNPQELADLVNVRDIEAEARGNYSDPEKLPQKVRSGVGQFYQDANRTKKDFSCGLYFGEHLVRHLDTKCKDYSKANFLEDAKNLSVLLTKTDYDYLSKAQKSLIHWLLMNGHQALLAPLQEYASTLYLGDHAVGQQPRQKNFRIESVMQKDGSLKINVHFFVKDAVILKGDETVVLTRNAKGELLEVSMDEASGDTSGDNLLDVQAELLVTSDEKGNCEVKFQEISAAALESLKSDLTVRMLHRYRLQDLPADDVLAFGYQARKDCVKYKFYSDYTARLEGEVQRLEEGKLEDQKNFVLRKLKKAQGQLASAKKEEFPSVTGFNKACNDLRRYVKSHEFYKDEEKKQYLKNINAFQFDMWRQLLGVDNQAVHPFNEMLLEMQNWVSELKDNSSYIPEKNREDILRLVLNFHRSCAESLMSIGRVTAIDDIRSAYVSLIDALEKVKEPQWKSIISKIAAVAGVLTLTLGAICLSSIAPPLMPALAAGVVTGSAALLASVGIGASVKMHQKARLAGRWLEEAKNLGNKHGLDDEEGSSDSERPK